jgi:hypothetical protein
MHLYAALRVENWVASLDYQAICDRRDLSTWGRVSDGGKWNRDAERRGVDKGSRDKKKDSSTRSSVRKSGKQAEMLEVEKVGVKIVF